MRILLDECVPALLADDLAEHEVRTVPKMGWASLENGALLTQADGKFDVFLTTDQRISYQQSVSKYKLALVVLVARRNQIEFLRRLIPDLRRTLMDIKPGKVYRIGS